MAQLAAAYGIVGDNELVIRVETTATIGWCPRCGVSAQAQDRTKRSVRDLSCFGQAVRLDTSRRRWRYCEALCEIKIWTENIEALDATAVLTRRAGAAACRQVGPLRPWHVISGCIGGR